MGSNEQDPLSVQGEQPVDRPVERRRGTDRRGGFRGGGRRAADYCRAGLVAGMVGILPATLASAAPPPAPPRVEAVRPAVAAPPVAFGIDMSSVRSATKQGADVSYGVFWVGSWTQKFGWGYAEQQLKAAVKQDVVPVINWWYWGDDISPKCVENGCTDPRQNVHKDRATWFRMANELADLIDRTMGDRETIVVLETEFNKNGIQQYAPFDDYLAQQMEIFHRKRNIRVVLGFGNWDRQHWGVFKRSIAASDMLGTQLLQSSVRDAASYTHAVDTLAAGARYIQKQFQKPSMVVDLALSSYPAAQYETYQAAVMRELFERLPELRAAGVRAIIWRQLEDDPKFDTSNYHGTAERHWGLIRADGAAKPALALFVNGTRSERREAPVVRAANEPATPAVQTASRRR